VALGSVRGRNSATLHAAKPRNERELGSALSSCHGESLVDGLIRPLRIGAPPVALPTTEIYMHLSPEDVIREFREKWLEPHRSRD
jgi:hypothetical protein